MNNNKYNSLRKYFVHKGDRFGKWTVLDEDVGKMYGKRCAKCECICGFVGILSLYRLCRGLSNGCRKCNSHRFRHGKSNSPEYYIYNGMLSRCYDPNSANYANYGGRGIIVCDRWKSSPKNFFDDMGDRPTSKHTLDRIDNSYLYSPENCRWATKKDQANNKRNNRYIFYNGQTLSVAQLKEKSLIKITLQCLHSRINYGWTIDRALTEPVHKHRSKI